MTKLYSSLILFFTLSAVAQSTYNLDPTSTSRFEVTDQVWPEAIGDASVCLWNDDKLAAFSITIDDNNEQDIEFWESMFSAYGLNYSWFVITEADDAYNVKDWSKYNELVDKGHRIEGHDDRNWYKTPTEEHPNTTAEEYFTRLQSTVNTIDSKITESNYHCLTYAYPYGEGNIDEMRKIFIAARGTNGLLNNANTVNYLDVNSVSNPHIYADQDSRDKYILPLISTTSTLYGASYYRGWGSTHFHSVSSSDSQTKTEEFLQYLKEKSTDLWVGNFTHIAQYSQSYATHSLSVDDTNDTELKFTLTDEMLNSAFNFPLTVKIRVANDWVNVSAIQDGNSIEANLIEFDGKKYALVKAIPDAGQATVKGIKDTNPAIITPIQDQQVEEEKSIEVHFSASTATDEPITFTVQNLPSFGKLKTNNDNSGSISFDPNKFDSGSYQIIVLANNGRSQSSTIFNLTVVPDASTATIYSSTEDASPYYPEHNFVDPNNRTSIIVGGGYVDTKQMSAVFPFKLPTLPNGASVSEARFSVNLESINNPSTITGSINLFGLEARETATVLISDGYAGKFETTSGATAIQENFSNANTPLGLVYSEHTNLVKYLNEQYQYNNGEYIFLRLSTNDINQAMYSRTSYTTADGALSDQSLAPQLVLSFGQPTDLTPAKENQTNVFPNPMTGTKLNISSNENFKVKKIEVISLDGRVEYMEHTNASIINLDIKKGLYIIKVYNEKDIEIHKLIKG